MKYSLIFILCVEFINDATEGCKETMVDIGCNIRLGGEAFALAAVPMATAPPRCQAEGVEQGVYWLGITREGQDGEWFTYDGILTNYDNWEDQFPDTMRNAYSCAIARFRCVVNCTMKWENRDCTKKKDITATLCESRKSPLLEEVENQVNSSIEANSSITEQWVQDIFSAFNNTFISTADTMQGIRVLLAVAERDSDIVVSKRTIEEVFSTAQTFHESIEKQSPSFSISQREKLVRTMELFLDRVELPDSEKVENFNTTDFYAQVQYIDKSIRKDVIFYPPGKQGSFITVPYEAVMQMNGTVGAGLRSRISFIRYRDSLLLPSKYEISQVLLAQINGKRVEGLKSPVTYSIPLSVEKDDFGGSYGQCAFWNFSTSSWSDEGCFFITTTPSPLCGCNHLTNFGLLVEIVRRPSYTTFNLISRVIGGISCLGFFLTAAIYLFFKDLRRSNPGPVHINLCICYGMGYLIFLAGADQVEHPILCLAITVLTHFFFLSGWIWTFFEAFTMYQLFVKTSASLGEHYHLYISLVSYILPLIVVAVNVGLTIGYLDTKSPIRGFERLSDEFTLMNSSYTSGYSCWLTGQSLYFGFLVEGGVIFTLNVIFSALVLHSITCGRQKIRSTRNENSPAEALCRVVVIASLLGFVWLLAIPTEILATEPSAVEPVTYIFSTLIAMQGIVVFYLLCVRHVKARKLCWNFIFRDGKAFASSNTASTSINKSQDLINKTKRRGPYAS